MNSTTQSVLTHTAIGTAGGAVVGCVVAASTIGAAMPAILPIVGLITVADWISRPGHREEDGNFFDEMLNFFGRKAVVVIGTGAAVGGVAGLVVGVARQVFST